MLFVSILIKGTLSYIESLLTTTKHEKKSQMYIKELMAVYVIVDNGYLNIEKILRVQLIFSLYMICQLSTKNESVIML